MKAKKEAPYHWYQGASVRELFDRLQAAGPDTARLEVRTKGKAMFLRVVPNGSVTPYSGPPDTNESHVCPPQC